MLRRVREAIVSRVSPPAQLKRAQEEGWGYDGTMASEQEVVHLLTAIIYATKPETCVETGTYAGHGTKAIQAGLMANEKGHLHTIEYNEKNEYPPLERVTFILGDSIKWTGGPDCPDPIDFAFVDCCERPEHRVTVFSQLLPRMRDGGLICAHDTEFYRYEDYLDKMNAIAPITLHLPVLNGFTLWQR
jgi:predicted O-methyltransferase YrrM